MDEDRQMLWWLVVKVAVLFCIVAFVVHLIPHWLFATLMSLYAIYVGMYVLALHRDYQRTKARIEANLRELEALFQRR